ALDGDGPLASGNDDDGRRQACGLADADGRGAAAEREQRGGIDGQRAADGSAAGPGSLGSAELDADRAGAADGRRGNADWLLCRDGYWRAVEPGTFPLAHAAAGRVGQLRAYGNGLDVETATAFAEAVRELVDERRM